MCTPRLGGGGGEKRSDKQRGRISDSHKWLHDQVASLEIINGAVGVHWACWYGVQKGQQFFDEKQVDSSFSFINAWLAFGDACKFWHMMRKHGDWKRMVRMLRMLRMLGMVRMVRMIVNGRGLVCIEIFRRCRWISGHSPPSCLQSAADYLQI